jgi:hypothetical protein
MTFLIDSSERARKQAAADLFNCSDVGYQQRKARKQAYSQVMSQLGFGR